MGMGTRLWRRWLVCGLLASGMLAGSVGSVSAQPALIPPDSEPTPLAPVLPAPALNSPPAEPTPLPEVVPAQGQLPPGPGGASSSAGLPPAPLPFEGDDADGPLTLPKPPAGTVPALSASELEALVAGIALYPDDLLDTVLDAVQTPVAIRQAAELANGKEDGQLAQLLQDGLPASVQLLQTEYPQMLQELNDNLLLMSRLGLAIRSQPEDVVAAIREVRSQAAQLHRQVAEVPVEQEFAATTDGLVDSFNLPMSTLGVGTVWDDGGVYAGTAFPNVSYYSYGLPNVCYTQFGAWGVPVYGVDPYWGYGGYPRGWWFRDAARLTLGIVALTRGPRWGYGPGWWGGPGWGYGPGWWGGPGWWHRPGWAFNPGWGVGPGWGHGIGWGGGWWGGWGGPGWGWGAHPGVIWPRRGFGPIAGSGIWWQNRNFGVGFGRPGWGVGPWQNWRAGGSVHGFVGRGGWNAGPLGFGGRDNWNWNRAGLAGRMQFGNRGVVGGVPSHSFVNSLNLGRGPGIRDWTTQRTGIVGNAASWHTQLARGGDRSARSFNLAGNRLGNGSLISFASQSQRDWSDRGNMNGNRLLASSTRPNTMQMESLRNRLVENRTQLGSIPNLNNRLDRNVGDRLSGVDRTLRDGNRPSFGSTNRNEALSQAADRLGGRGAGGQAGTLRPGADGLRDRIGSSAGTRLSGLDGRDNRIGRDLSSQLSSPRPTGGSSIASLGGTNDRLRPGGGRGIDDAVRPNLSRPGSPSLENRLTRPGDGSSSAVSRILEQRGLSGNRPQPTTPGNVGSAIRPELRDRLNAPNSNSTPLARPGNTTPSLPGLGSRFGGYGNLNPGNSPTPGSPLTPGGIGSGGNRGERPATNLIPNRGGTGTSPTASTPRPGLPQIGGGNTTRPTLTPQNPQSPGIRPQLPSGRSPQLPGNRPDLSTIRPQLPSAQNPSPRPQLPGIQNPSPRPVNPQTPSIRPQLPSGQNPLPRPSIGGPQQRPSIQQSLPSSRPGLTIPQTPSVRPQLPTSRPSAPAVRPSIPSVRPSAPAARPSIPSVRPSAPAARPSVPSFGGGRSSAPSIRGPSMGGGRAPSIGGGRGGSIGGGRAPSIGGGGRGGSIGGGGRGGGRGR